MVSLTLSRFTGPEMNESLTSKFYFCTSRKLASNVFFALCCLFFFCFVFFIYCYAKKRDKEGVSETAKRKRGKETAYFKLHK